MIGIGLGILIATTLSLLKDPPKEQTTTPCNCLDYYRYEYLSNKRDILVDKLQYSRRTDFKELRDSLKKINLLLGITEPYDLYPER